MSLALKNTIADKGCLYILLLYTIFSISKTFHLSNTQRGRSQVVDCQVLTRSLRN